MDRVTNRLHLLLPLFCDISLHLNSFCAPTKRKCDTEIFLNVWLQLGCSPCVTVGMYVRIVVSV